MIDTDNAPEDDIVIVSNATACPICGQKPEMRMVDNERVRAILMQCVEQCPGVSAAVLYSVDTGFLEAAGRAVSEWDGVCAHFKDQIRKIRASSTVTRPFMMMPDPDKEEDEEDDDE